MTTVNIIGRTVRRSGPSCLPGQGVGMDNNLCPFTGGVHLIIVDAASTSHEHMGVPCETII